MSNSDLANNIFNALFDDDDLNEMHGLGFIAQPLGYKISSVATIELELDESTGWVKKSEILPRSEGVYIVNSTYGVRCAFFQPDISRKFQDCATNNDEGMSDLGGDVYKVTHWMPLPEPPKQ
ncbi:hypothetical protein VPHK359_0012 [Vibrio phage K359]